MGTKIFLFSVILFMVVAGVGYYFGYDIVFERAVKTYLPETKMPASGFRIGNNAIYVTGQKPGNSVTIGITHIEQGGYVAIHESVNEKPGAVIGNSALLSPGETRGFTIALSRISRDGEELFAMLHNDNGDGVFNSAEDQPVKDTEGNIIFMIFPVLEETEESGGVINL